MELPPFIRTSNEPASRPPKEERVLPAPQSTRPAAASHLVHCRDRTTSGVRTRHSWSALSKGNLRTARDGRTTATAERTSSARAVLCGLGPPGTGGLPQRRNVPRAHASQFPGGHHLLRSCQVFRRVYFRPGQITNVHRLCVQPVPNQATIDVFVIQMGLS
jgi:hypothetical protein